MKTTSPQNLVKVFLATLALITPLIALIFHFNQELRAVMYLKDLIVCTGAVVAGIYLIRSGKLWAWMLTLLPLLIYVGLSAFWSSAMLEAKLAAIRQLLYPFVFVAIGYAVQHSSTGKVDLKKFLFNLTWLTIGLGILMLVVGQKQFFWLHAYFEEKFHNSTFSPIENTGFPSQWIEPIWGGIPRMASTFFDPVNFGHFLVFALFLFSQSKSKNKTPLAALIVVALLLTFCKGAWLQALIVFFMCFFPIKLPYWLRLVAMLMIPFAVIISANYHAGIALHLRGITVAFESLKILGYGVGETGNVAVMFGAEHYPTIHDTFIGSLLGQLGILGVICWMLPFLVYLFKIRKSDFVLLWIVISLLVVGVYSENCWNLLSIAFPCVWLGIRLAQTEKPELTSSP